MPSRLTWSLASCFPEAACRCKLRAISTEWFKQGRWPKFEKGWRTAIACPHFLATVLIAGHARSGILLDEELPARSITNRQRPFATGGRGPNHGSTVAASPGGW